MEKFDINQLLRYFIVGGYLVLLLFLFGGVRIAQSGVSNRIAESKEPQIREFILDTVKTAPVEAGLKNAGDQTERLKERSDTSLPADPALVTFFSLVAGFLIYILYRATLFPLVLNPLILLLSKFLNRNSLSDNARRGNYYPGKSLRVWKAIENADMERWKLEGGVKEHLAEWASQVHFLYNIALVHLVLLAIPFLAPGLIVDVNVRTNAVLGLFFFSVGILHHVRYKNNELKLIVEKKQA